MENEWWQLIEECFQTARDLKGDERSRFLTQFCGSNAEMRRKVELLLKHDEQPDTLLAAPAVELVATALLPQTSVGPYEILSIAGVGGMGRVYRARDSRLKRDVAIKSLPIEFTYDSERRARFEREATLLASFNHPNIATIHDVVEHQSTPFLVLEFVEGATLAERLQNGPLPADEVLKIAHQIAVALEAAHEKGTVHRDLKPANIKITPEGKVKVLDFGVATALTEITGEAGAGRRQNTESTTDQSLFLGTPRYMSPEQIRGAPIGTRVDVWAFGCTIFELLSGRPAFSGETVTKVFNTILTGMPDWSLLPAGTSKELRNLLRGCLERDPGRRFQDGGSLRGEIERIISGIDHSNENKKDKRRYAAIAAVVAVLTLVGVLSAVRYMRQPRSLQVEDTRQLTLAAGLELDPSLSPDGERIAYALRTADRTDIYIQPIAGGQPSNLTKNLRTVGHRWPRWSPDGTSIAVVASDGNPRVLNSFNPDATLIVVPLDGGVARSVTNVSVLGHSWSPDGMKLAFIRGRQIYTSLADGREVRELAVAVEPHSPSWSPDGKWIAYVSGNEAELFYPTLIGNLAPSSIWIANADTGQTRQLTDGTASNSSPVWMPDSRSLVFVSNRGGSRDAFALELSNSGQPTPQPLRITTGLNALSMDISKDGRQIAYAQFLTRQNLWSVPIPESGSVSGADATPVTTGTQTIEGVSVTRDGQWIAFDSNRSGNQDIYKMRRDGGPPEQLTTDPHDDFLPSWSPDEKAIAFYSFRNGNRDLFVMSADGTSPQQITNDPAEERYPDWSPDGQSLAFFSNKAGPQEIYVVSKESGRWGEPRRITSSEGSQFPKWSPDGRRIAYIDLARGLSLISPAGQGLQLLVPRRRDLLTHPIYIAWSPGGETIYFKQNRNLNANSLWSIPANGGASKLLVQFDDADNSARAEFDTDGKALFFTMSERESDIWILRFRSR